jgi:AcrR family transcriptional regulator
MEGATPKAERAEATRAALMTAARELFTDRGYAAVGTEEIVRRADVTRGALYHHFADKRDLFRAVHEQMEGEIVAAIAARMDATADPLELLKIGTRAFLDACMDPAHARVNLLDAPSVLGWEEWREIDMRHGMGLITAGLQSGMEAGVLREQPVRPLAHLLLAAMGEAAMMIANSKEPRATRDEMEASLLELLEGLRA